MARVAHDFFERPFVRNAEALAGVMSEHRPASVGEALCGPVANAKVNTRDAVQTPEELIGAVEAKRRRSAGRQPAAGLFRFR